MPSSRPRNTPPIAASAPPMNQTMRMIFWLSMPVDEASSALSLTGTVALPRRVRCSARATATRITDAMIDVDR